MATVPPVDVEPSGPPDAVSKRLNDIEIRLLDAGAKSKENVNREADQRYWLRWAAVLLVIGIVLAMGLLLKHVAHKLPAIRDAGSPASFIIALYVSPIISMTTLSLSLLVAAFRGFKDGDDKSSAAALAEGARATGLIN